MGGSIYHNFITGLSYFQRFKIYMEGKSSVPFEVRKKIGMHCSRRRATSETNLPCVLFGIFSGGTTYLRQGEDGCVCAFYFEKG